MCAAAWTLTCFWPFGACLLSQNAEPNALELQRQAEERRKRRAVRQRRAVERAPTTPPAVEGRQHREIQTDLYLEEIAERAVEKDVEVQTDQFLDRPPSPIFVPAKLGTDATTQVYPGELFHFDTEVQPILEVIVGKTLQQALLEVMEEEEVENMRAHQREFQRIRDAELAETQRLEEAERRRYEEKERRLQQERVRLELEAEARAKISARSSAKNFLGDLFGTVFSALGESGYFYDAVERDVETGFMPWLMKQVEANLARKSLATSLVDSVVGAAIDRRKAMAEAHALFLAQEAERLRLEAEAAAAKAAEDERLRLEAEAAAALLANEGDEAPEAAPVDASADYSGDYYDDQ